MGKKNFLDRYDPFAEQISRDAERMAAIAAPPKPPSPVPISPPAAPPVREIERPQPPPPVLAPPPTKLAQIAAEADIVEVSPRLKVSQAAFQDLEGTLSNFHRVTGSQIHYSIATRALWGLLVQAEAQIQEELRKNPLGRLPSTRDKLAYAVYEERVKQAFGLAFRKLPRSLFQPVAQSDEAANEG